MKAYRFVMQRGDRFAIQTRDEVKPHGRGKDGPESVVEEEKQTRRGRLPTYRQMAEQQLPLQWNQK